MNGPAARPSADQLHLFTGVDDPESEDVRIEHVNRERAARRGFLVFAIDSSKAPDEVGYRRVFVTEAKTGRKAMAKVRHLVPKHRLRAYLATGPYRDELAEAEWVK